MTATQSLLPERPAFETPSVIAEDQPQPGLAQQNQQPRSRRLTSIDVLRAVAALAVLFVHIPGFAYGGWRENPWLVPSLLMNYGYLGVPLFIILSGFCIHLRIAEHARHANAASVNWKRFWLRRFLRLYPPYLVAIGFSLSLAYGVHHRYLAQDASGAADLAWHLLLVHNLSERFSLTLGNGAFWSLGTEEQLYLLYMVIAGFFMRKKWKLLLAVGAATTIGFRVFDSFSPSFRTGPDFFPLALAATPFMFWLHWIMGAVAVEAGVGSIVLPKWCSSSRVAVCFLAVGFLFNPLLFRFLKGFNILRSSGFTGSCEEVAAEFPWLPGAARHFSELLFAVGFFLIVNWCVKTEMSGGFRSVTARLFARLGGMSYSLYLTHVPVICSCEVFMPFGWTAQDWLLRMSVYSSVSLMVAYIFFCLVEKPCLKLLTRF